MFSNCASISLSTFYKHQNLYLQPAIMNVWNKEQKQMIETLEALGEPLLEAMREMIVLDTVRSTGLIPSWN